MSSGYFPRYYIFLNLLSNFYNLCYAFSCYTVFQVIYPTLLLRQVFTPNWIKCNNTVLREFAQCFFHFCYFFHLVHLCVCFRLLEIISILKVIKRRGKKLKFSGFIYKSILYYCP